MRNDLEVLPWQHDLWIQIIRAAMSKAPDQVPLDWHASLSQPAVSKYSATSPSLLRWLAKWNADKPYEAQIRPFGFMLEYIARSGPFAEWQEEEVEQVRRGRRKHERLKPIAPFETNHKLALDRVFDRETGDLVHIERLKTYAECLADYHISLESKFENGDYADRGRTERRHVLATGVVLIGKEANQVGDSGEADPIATPVTRLLWSRGSVATWRPELAHV